MITNSWVEVLCTSTFPTLSAEGPSGNHDLAFLPKGANGRVRFGSWTFGAGLSISGYIEIKDSSGIVRKLAVVS